ncbi:MAG TPA: efflux RND transporter permease subunit, partial [Bacillota bacterium]
NLSALSVRRPVTVVMATLVVVLLGAVSLQRLPVELFPDLSFPITAVVTGYPDAAPQEVESLVTRPLEEALATVDRVRSVASDSVEGTSIVILDFEWGTDMDVAVMDVRDRVDQVLELLPDEVERPVVYKFDPRAAPVLRLTMGGARSPTELLRLGEDTIAPRLARIEGVASVDVSGAPDREVRVTLDPARLEAYGLTMDAVVNALRAGNVDRPGGSVTEGDRELLIRSTARLSGVEDLRDLPVPAAGGVVRLRQLGRVDLALAEQESISRLDGEPAVEISVVKEPRANTVQVVREVMAELARLQADLPSDLEIAVVEDQSEFVQRSIRNVMFNGAVGGVLAVLVLYAFLRHVPATLVVATAIPVSVIATFVPVYFAGITLNLVSLGGLGLGIGMLVDNAIVVLESIYRRRQDGDPPDQAALAGTGEVATAISASTLTTIAVFLPVIFVGGFTAEVFEQLALTVSFSLVVSLAGALTLVPMLASRLLARQGPGAPSLLAGTEAAGPVRSRGLAGAVEGLVRAALGRRRLVAGIALAGLALAGLGLFTLGTEFMPALDQGQVNIAAQLPAGSTLEAADRVARRLEEEASRVPEVESVMTRVTDGTAGVTLNLVPQSERDRSAFDISADLRRRLAAVPGADISVTEPTIFGPPSGGGISQLEVRITGPDLTVLEDLAQRVLERIRDIPGVVEPDTSFERVRPELRVVFDRERLASLGMVPAQAGAAVESAFTGIAATRLHTEGDPLDVRVVLDPTARSSVDDVEALRLDGPGGTVLLGEVARLERGTGAQTISRDDRERTASVFARVAGASLGEVSAAVERALADLPVPAGYALRLAGETQRMNEAFGDLGFSLLLSVVLIYMILASLYENFVHPIAVMLTVPFGLVGSILSLVLTARNLSVVAYIGLIMVGGIVVNNAIVLVDYVNLLRSRGLERGEALVRAAGVRLRPILMTTLTTVLGMLPLALGIGEGSEAEAPLATVVVGGLVLSTLVTLVLVPVAYSFLDDLGRWVRRRRARAS